MRGRLIRSILATALIAGGALTAISTAAPPASAASGCLTAGQSGVGVGTPLIGAGTITIDDEITVISGTTCTGGANAPASLPWKPPPCWWAPLYTPGQLQEVAGSYAADDPLLNDYYVTDGGKSAMPAGYQSTDGPDYWDWNVAQGQSGPGAQGDPPGMWWGLVVNGAMLNTASGLGTVSSCIADDTLDSHQQDWTWVVNGAPDDAATAPVITDELLAEYAAETIELPTTTFYSSPAEGTDLTVNLPTWLWMDGANYTPQTLQLCWTPSGNQAPGGNQYCSTVVATPKTFAINTSAPPGDYTIFNGGCVPTTEPDGTWIGTPYADGKDQGGSPPCGITFTHSSAGVPGGFGLYITVNWSISWNDGGPPNWPVADPLETDTVTYPVQEIENLGGG